MPCLSTINGRSPSLNLKKSPLLGKDREALQDAAREKLEAVSFLKMPLGSLGHLPWSERNLSYKIFLSRNFRSLSKIPEF